MKKRIINPWTWQEERGYMQAVEESGIWLIFCEKGSTALTEKHEA